MKKLVRDLEKCTGCRTCELACSFKREGAFNPKKSAIRVIKDERIGLDGPVVCEICPKPKCVEACPERALAKTLGLGVVKVDEKKCTGCGECEEACPFGAVYIHPNRRLPIICDLCDGTPVCVEWCHAEALVFSAPGTSKKQLKQLRTMLHMYRPLMRKWGIPEVEEEEGGL